ncbi:MAG: hypothetical protein AAF928_05980 [Myxococcota bacterium]
MSTLIGITMLLGITTGCGGGLETEEATEVCNEIEKREPSQFDSNGTTRATCIACYEDCGNDCSPGDTTEQGIATFQCGDDVCTVDGC